MTTETLLNHYLFEQENEVVNVTAYGIYHDTIIVHGEGRRFEIPLIEYMTFIYNKLKL